MRVVVAPDSFKGSISAPEAARAIADGIRSAAPRADVMEVPLADGGEGTLDVLMDALGGNRRRTIATGPLGAPVEVTLGLINQAATAIIEMAQVCGLGLVPARHRNPLRASTFGLGEVIRTILEAGIDDILLTVGGSATVDGGAGMMQALGLTLLDHDGRPLPHPIGGGGLTDIWRIVWDKPPEAIEHCTITVACDVLNPACGPQGAARIFGPQKGADAAAVQRLERGLSHWAGLLEKISGRNFREEPGTGAGGAVALPIVALTSSSIVPGIDLVADSVGLATRIADADLVITGEGRLDRQSLMGKVVGAVGRMARAAEVPCVAIVGAAGEGAEEALTVLDKFWALNGPLDETAVRLSKMAAQVAGEMF